MKFIYFLFFTLSIDAVFGKIEDDWNNFKEYYNKNYSSEAEEQHHFNNFKNNIKEIHEHNKLYDDNVVSYKKGVTKFADLNSTEFVKIYRLDARPMKIYNTTYPDNNSQASNGSEYVNWREKGAVTRVKDQGTCGSCWVFSAVGTLEGYHFRKTKKLVTLSEQNLIDCISNDTCNGGWPPSVFLYLLQGNQGINKEEDYPYKGVNGKCRYDKLKNVKLNLVNSDDVGMVIANDEALKYAVRNFGPMVVCVYAGEKWQLYRSGVWYAQECSDESNHAVLLVGFGRENGHDYWLIKNSWSKDWGENGYIKIARGKHDNYCAINKLAYFIR